MTEKQIVTRIRQIMYDRKLSGTESNAGELNRLKAELKALRGQQSVAEDYDEFDDEEESELHSGGYVRDKQDSSGEVFIMRGDPYDRRVQITDRNGSGWNISPSRLVAVDDNDPAIARYFGEQGMMEDDDAIKAYHDKGGKVKKGEYKPPRKSEKTTYGSKHIGGAGDRMKTSRTGTAANTRGNKIAGMAEGSMGGINRCAPSSDVSYEKVLDDVNQKWKMENTPLPEDESGIPMVRNNIKTIKRAINDLENSISDYDEIDEWAKEKLAISKSMITTVVDYIMSEKAQGNHVVEDTEGPIEAYGYAYNKRDQRVVWRKVFKSAEAAYQWADSKNATVLGTRPAERSSKESGLEEKAPCWKNYKQYGMKVKGGKQVPNCVPVNEHEVTLEGDAFMGILEDSLLEADYHGHKVELNKPMQGDVKKFKVYVKDPSTGNIKKVNFGDPNMRIRKSNPGARKSFRARHNCKNPGPKTRARYWSCRAW